MADAPPPPPPPAASSSSSSSSPPPPPSAASVHPLASGKSCGYCFGPLLGRWKRCGGCKLAYYCSLEHALANWAAHKPACLAEQARIEAAARAGGLVLSAGTEAERAAARAEAEAAREAAGVLACERARVEALSAEELRQELDMRGLAAEAADAALTREALAALRRSAPEPTAETMAAYVARQRLARAWRACRLCSNELAEPTGTAGRCAGCKRVRYCGAECQRGDWPRHRPECRAWRAEADAAVVAAGGCPLGDLAAQREAIDRWAVRPLDALRAAAEGGDIAAQLVLGSTFERGVPGLPKDLVQAVAWFRRAAAGNVATAQFNLGIMHQRGDGGLSVNLEEAARLYALAARQGVPEAQYNLGVCLRDGEGVPRDLEAAFRSFRQAADSGDADAQAETARALMYGDGVAVDYFEALVWARRAADQRNAAGELILGVLYAQGRGVPRDVPKAVVYFSLSAGQGLGQAIKILRDLAAGGVAEAAAALRRLRLAP